MAMGCRGGMLPMERNLRIGTGLVLYIFIACHLINVSLGVVSAELIEDYRPLFMTIWSSTAGGYLLLASLLVHACLGLRTLYYRNTLQMTFADSLQFSTGFLILPLMIPHVWGIVAMNRILDVSPTYPVLMQLFWIDNPLEGIRQVLLIMIVWVHGSIGIFTWLQLKSWWPRVAPFVYPLIVLVPVMALLGFVEGGNLAISKLENSLLETSGDYDTAQDTTKGQDTGYAENQTANDPYANNTVDEATYAENYAFVVKVKWYAILVYAGLLVTVLLARAWRIFNKSGSVRVVYDDGSTIDAPVGRTFLELANIHHVPHASLCRGRGRCGTCRIRIGNSTSQLSEASQLEQDALRITHSDIDMRLACQCVPGPGIVHIERVFQPDISHGDLWAPKKPPSQNPNTATDKVPAQEVA